MKKTRILCVIGKSGSGKGTQVELLKEKINDARFMHVVSGDLLRAFIRQKNPLAQKVGGMMNRGNLAPDWLTDHLWQAEFLKNIGKISGAVFEGTPRTLNQTHLIDDVCATMFDVKPFAVYVAISDAEAKRRLLIRLVCAKCKQPVPYHLIASRPKTCSLCGGPIVRRKDDNEKAILNRLRFFRKSVVPVIAWYRKQNRLIYVNGEQDVSAVFSELWNGLRKRRLV